MSEEKKFLTDSNIEVKRIYTKDDTKPLDEDAGSYPFTRGIYPDMYRARLWTMRQYTGFGSAEETNARFKFLLEHGQTGLSLAFDLPTQTGYDSDHPRSEGEVGRVGVAISSLKDMMICFDGIPLDKVSTSMTINSTANILLSFYIAVAESQGIAQNMLRGTLQNDILKEYIARNTYIYPPEPSIRLFVDSVEYCSKNVPKWYPISISGYHMREAGATAIQELAFTFANAIAYTEACINRGLNVDDFAPRLSFFWCCTIDILEEIAKFRAARRIWAKIMKERFNAQNPKSMHLRFHVQTSGESLTAQQPDNNIIRVALQALAAVLGGCQSLHTNSKDEALSLPTEHAVKIALRTQQIIAYESGVTRTVDPLGGSYFIEHLTDTIEEEVNKYLAKIDSMGGSLKAIEKGYFQDEIRKNAYRLKKEVDEGKRIIVGVNKFVDKEDIEPEIHVIDPEIEKKQIARLKELKASRDKSKVEHVLSRLKEVAESDENTMPYIIDAVKNYATLGEISDVFREVFGVYKPKISF
ncbi:MAG: methylmalonyl-CoA mutase [Candidatus Nitrosocaldaceae archaeon]|nr:MAG: methylmalonyl-CoA mutase [Candidatus Nitrosocaldaceae archaeon]